MHKCFEAFALRKTRKNLLHCEKSSCEVEAEADNIIIIMELPSWLCCATKLGFRYKVSIVKIIELRVRFTFLHKETIIEYYSNNLRMQLQFGSVIAN